jgi:hypothetical protein
MTITILGGLTGGLMTRATAAQLTEARAIHRMTLFGAHTVGAPDGEPGMPGIHWSAEHGDLRVPHFVGLHALQVLPLTVLALRRRKMTESRRAYLIVVGAISYTVLFALLLWQALRGQSVIHPDAITGAAVAGWAVLTAVMIWIVPGRRNAPPSVDAPAPVLGGGR